MAPGNETESSQSPSTVPLIEAPSSDAPPSPDAPPSSDAPTSPGGPSSRQSRHDIRQEPPVANEALLSNSLKPEEGTLQAQDTTEEPDDSPIQALFSAITGGYKKPMRHILKRYPKAVSRQKDGNYPLHQACLYKKPAIAKYLLNANASLSQQNSHGDTPLAIAYKVKSPELVGLLVNRYPPGDLLENHTRNLTNILPLAVDSSSLKAVVRLLQIGVDINGVTDKGDTALIRACDHQSSAFDGILECLLEHAPEKLRINIQNKNRFTALNTAVKNSRCDAVLQLLLRKYDWFDGEIDVNLQDFNGHDPLSGAVKASDTEMVDILLHPERFDTRTRHRSSPPYAGDECSRTSSPVEGVSSRTKLIQAPRSLEDRSDLELWEAAIDSNIDDILYLLKAHGLRFPPQSDELALDGRVAQTPLLYAIKQGKTQAALTLLRLGASHTQISSDGDTPLHKACRQNMVEAVQGLIEAGADPRTGDEDGCLPLTIAVLNNSVLVVEKLLALNPDMKVVRDKGLQGATALHVASHGGSLGLVDILLKAGAKLDLPDNSGMTPLMLAAGGGYSDVVRRLLSSSPHLHINQQNKGGQSALNIASFNGWLGVVDILLEAGAKLDLPDNHGVTPLMIAARGGYSDVVGRLLSSSPRLHINQQGKDGVSALHIASEFGWLGVVDRLLEAGAKLDLPDYDGMTPLMLAASAGFHEVVGRLLSSSAGPHISQQDEEGRSALWHACYQGSKKVVKMLLEHHSDPNLPSERGTTPFVAAVEAGHFYLVSYLVESTKVQVNAMHRGQTPLFQAFRYDNSRIALYLLGHGAKPEITDNKGRNALHRACAMGLEDVAIWCIDKNSDLVVATSSKYMTPLSYAAGYIAENAGSGRHRTLARLLTKLLEHKDCNPWQRNRWGVSAVTYLSKAYCSLLSKSFMLSKLTDEDHLQNALLWASQQAETHPLVRLLLQKAARTGVLVRGYSGNLWQRNDGHNWSAIEWASFSGYPEVVKSLLETRRQDQNTAKAVLSAKLLLLQNHFSPIGHREKILDMLTKLPRLRLRQLPPEFPLGDHEWLSITANVEMAVAKFSELGVPQIEQFTIDIGLFDDNDIETSNDQVETFIWYHLPANNMKWMKDAVSKIYYTKSQPASQQCKPPRIDSNQYEDSDSSQDTEGSDFSQDTEDNDSSQHSEGSGSSQHSEDSGSSQHSEDSGPRQHSEDSGSNQHSEDSGPIQHSEESGPIQHSEDSDFLDTEDGRLSSSYGDSDEGILDSSIMQGIPMEISSGRISSKRQKSEKLSDFSECIGFLESSGLEVPNPATDSRYMKPRMLRLSEQRGRQGSPDDNAASNPEPVVAAIYVPYVTMAATPSEDSPWASELDELSKPNSSRICHKSRTLDEFYYQFADTGMFRQEMKRRNQDQVVGREIAAQQEEKKETQPKLQADQQKQKQEVQPKVTVQVDQLWIWIVEGAIITSATHRSDGSTEPVFKAVHDILNLNNAGSMYSQPSSALELAVRLVEVCIGFFDSSFDEEIYNSNRSIRQLFSDAINRVAIRETQVSNSLRIGRGWSKKNTASPDSYPNQESHKKDFDPSEVTKLLTEIKDIRDELNIIKQVCTYQNDVQQQVEQALAAQQAKQAGVKQQAKSENLNEVENPDTDTSKRVQRAEEAQQFLGNTWNHLSSAASTIRDIEAMDQTAARVQQAVFDTMTISQTLETIQQGQQSNEQGEESVRQGRTLMIFTIITVFFLPLSFLCALFAMDVESFQNAPSWSLLVLFLGPLLFSTPVSMAVLYSDDIFTNWRKMGDSQATKGDVRENTNASEKSAEQARRRSPWPRRRKRSDLEKAT